MKTIDHFLACALLCMGLTSAAQSLDLSVGANYNTLYKIKKDESRGSSSYNSGAGYGVVFGVNTTKVGHLMLRFTAGFENYRLDFQNRNSGRGGYNETKAKINRNAITLGLFPINFALIDHWEFNLGVTCSFVIYDKVEGTRESQTWAGPDSEHSIVPLESKFDGLSSRMYVGVQGRMAYEIAVGEAWSLTPQLSGLLGVSNELEMYRNDAHSIRFFVGIGLKRQLK